MRRWQCNCGAYNTWVEKHCEACGTQRGKAVESPESREGRLCPVDDAPLDSRGFCARGNGFALDAKCPFVCPLCRSALTWSGGCDSCKGTGRSPAPRELWAFPGDRYEPQGGHFVRVCGPRKACTPEENKAGLKAIRAILADAPVTTGKPPGRHQRAEVLAQARQLLEAVASPSRSEPMGRLTP